MADEPTTGTTDTSTTTGTATTEAAKTETGKTETSVLGTKAPAEEAKTETKTEAKADGDKTTEGAKKDDKPAAPIDAKAFKLPDGFTADEKQLGEFAAFATEHKIPLDAAQKLVDMHVNALKAASETGSKFWADKNAEWAKELKADFGEEPMKNPKTIAVAKMIDSLGEKQAADFRAAIDFVGAGNSPGIIRGLVALAERLTEPGHAKGDPTGKPSDPAAAFYPNMKQG